jgi:hypothetical protein
MHYTNHKKYSDFGSFLVGKDATQFEILGGLCEAEPLPPAVTGSLGTSGSISPHGARSCDPTGRGHVIRPLPHLLLPSSLNQNQNMLVRHLVCLLSLLPPPPSTFTATIDNGFLLMQNSQVYKWILKLKLNTYFRILDLQGNKKGLLEQNRFTQKHLFCFTYFPA